MNTPSRLAPWLIAACVLWAPAAVTVTAQIPPGHVKTWRKISATSGGLPAGLLDAGDEFGRSVACIGDLNGDGVLDLAVGAPYDDDAGTDAGAVYILHMLADGTVGEARKITDGVGGVDLQLSGGEEFGFAVAHCHDFNGDGFDDLIVGAPGAQRTYIIMLDPVLGTVPGAIQFTATGGGGCPVTRSGQGVTEIKNPPGDPSFTWVLTASPNFSPDDDFSHVYLLQARSDLGFQVVGEDCPDNKDIGACFADVSGATFDTSAQAGPGAVVALAGAPAEAQEAGGFWRFDLNDNQLPFSGLSRYNDGPEDNGDRSGSALAYLGVFGSALGVAPYLAVGAPFTDGTGTLHIYSLTSQDNDGLPDKGVTWWSIGQGLGGFPPSLSANDQFASALATIPDFNSDGTPDIAVGAPGDDDGAPDAGAVWMLFLQPSDGTAITNTFAPSLDGRPGRGSVPKSIAAGTEDISLDLLIVTPSLDGTTVQATKLISGPEGDVSFQPQSNEGFPVGSEPQQAILDLADIDGFVDILSVNKTGGSDSMGSLTFLQGVGDGTFVVDQMPISPNEQDLSGSGVTSPVLIGSDFMDADGFLDAVVGGNGGVTVKFGVGTGSFPMFSTVNVSDITDLALGDLDGDGDVDVLAASGAVALGPGNELGFLTPLINQGGVQMGTPGDLIASTAFGPSPQKAVASVLLGTFDADTSLDALVVLHELDGGGGTAPQATIQLWLNNGSGVFTQSAAWAGESFPNPDRIHPTYGVLGDIDNDGDIDAVYLSNDSLAYDATLFTGEYPELEGTVLTNQGGDQLGTEGVFVSSVIGTAYSGKGLAPVLADITPLNIGPPQTVGDGNLDIILVWYQDEDAGTGNDDPNFTTFFAALKGDGTGAFEDVTGNQTGTGPNPGSGSTGNGGPPPSLDTYAGASLDPAAIDVIVPNEADNSLSILFGVGDGTLVPGPITLAVDPTMPPLGLTGGPIDARFTNLNGDQHLDVVVYGQWGDPAEPPSNLTVLGSLITLLGDGTGVFTATDFVGLAFGGEIALGDVTGDSIIDIVVTQRHGAGAPQTVVTYPGAGDGSLASPLSPKTAPGGHSLTGGLTLADVDGDSLLDAITSSTDSNDEGYAVIYPNSGSALGSADESPLIDALLAPVTWTSITGVAAVDVTDDGTLDIALGERDGRLFVLEGLGAGTFQSLTLSPGAAAAGGGPFAVTDMTGDGRPDLVVTSDADPGTVGTPNPDQAFVRIVKPLGAPGGLFLDTIGGSASVSPRRGALRPMVADMNGDGQPDVILVHGTSDRVTVTPNAVGGFEAYGTGKSGKGGITPKLTGIGFPRVGKTINLAITDVVGGAPAGLLIGFDRNESSWIHIALPLFDQLIVFTMPGAAGAAGAGATTIPIAIPNDPSLPLLFEQTGVELTVQVLFKDDDAGVSPPLAFSATNGLAIEILP